MQKEQILQALSTRWIEDYTTLSNPGPRDGFLLMGFVNSVLSELQENEVKDAIKAFRNQPLTKFSPNPLTKEAPAVEGRPEPTPPEGCAFAESKPQPVPNGDGIPAIFDGPPLPKETIDEPAQWAAPPKSLDTTLTNNELIEKCSQWISDLCAGREKWRMHIPARPNKDPDLLFSTLTHRFKEAIDTIEHLEKQITELHESLRQLDKDNDYWRDRTRNTRKELDHRNDKLRQADEKLKEHEKERASIIEKHCQDERVVMEKEQLIRKLNERIKQIESEKNKDICYVRSQHQEERNSLIEKIKQLEKEHRCLTFNRAQEHEIEIKEMNKRLQKSDEMVSKLYELNDSRPEVAIHRESRQIAETMEDAYKHIQASPFCKSTKRITP